MSTANTIIDPSTINPNALYPTARAAEIFGLSPQGFIERARRKAVEPVATGGRARRWRGSDLMVMLDYVPIAIPKSEANRRNKEAVAGIRKIRQSNRAAANAVNR